MATIFEAPCETLTAWDTHAANISVQPGGIGGTNGIGSSVAPYSTPWLVARVAPDPVDTITFHWFQWIPSGGLPFTGASYYVVAAVYYSAGGAFAFANRQVSVNVTADGKFYFARGGYAGTVIAGPTAAPVWVANTWNEVEITIKVSATVGEITVLKAGVAVLTATGLNTMALGTAAIDGVEIIPQSTAGSGALIDNVTVSDASPDPVDEAPAADAPIIRRLRRAPHLGNQGGRVAYSSLEVALEAGLGLSHGQGSEPLVMLRWSNDGGQTWSPERTVSAGLIGQYKARAVWSRLGQSRDRVFEVSVSDPIPWRLVDAYVGIRPDGQP